MFRRVAVPTVMPVVGAARFASYKPSEDLLKLYDSDFEAGKYPIALIPSDTNLFAQFLYKAQEPKGAFDAVLNDIKTVQAAKLPVFWERTHEVEEIKEFANLAPATKFTMIWMQKNGLLGNFNEVATSYNTLVNAQKKKHPVKIYVGDAKADTKAAQEDAKKMQAGTPFEGFNLNFETVVDSSIVSGYNVEACGKFLSKATGASAAAAGAASGPVDYTAVPQVTYAKTPLPENIEGEILGRYFENLAQFDEEEAKNGV